VHVQVLGYDSCRYGTVTVTGGGLQFIGVGGQEFQIDNFCAMQDDLSSAPESQINTGLNVDRNYPNPFNPSTTIAFSNKESGLVHLSIIDLAGRRVTSLVHGHLEAGNHEVFWNGQDSNGRQAATGVYFVQLSSGKGVVNRKITMVK